MADVRFHESVASCQKIHFTSENNLIKEGLCIDDDVRLLLHGKPPKLQCEPEPDVWTTGGKSKV